MPLDLNPYLYCGNNPINRVDPDGKAWWDTAINYVKNTAQKIVSAVVNTANKVMDTIGGAINSVIERASNSSNKAVSTVAKAVGKTADWVGGNWGRALAVGAAVGVVLAPIILTTVEVAVAAVTVTYNTVAASSIMSSISASAGTVGCKTFGALKRAIGPAGKGMQWHHIVEQSQIAKSGFSPTMINSINNVVRISAQTHARISGYYNTTSFDFTGGMSVRNWLAGQSFEQQYQFGVNVLKNFGVIK